MNLMFYSQKTSFYQYDLDLDPMTCILNLKLDMVKMFHHTKDEVSILKHSKLQTDRQKVLKD